MNEPRDEELSRIYRDAEAPEPPQRVDDNILAASRRVAGARPRSDRSEFARRWGVPVALAATVVVTSTVTLMVFERQSDQDTIAPAAQSADQPSKSKPAEPKPVVRAPAAPVPQAEARRGRGAPETLRKREETRSAPAAATPSGSLSSGERAGADPSAPSPDAQRAPEVRKAPRPPAATLAADANTLRESALTLQRAGVISAPAGRAAVSEAKERTPEKWLEDIRKLKTQGKTVEVERELAEFKKRHPDYRLPEDLR